MNRVVPALITLCLPTLILLALLELWFRLDARPAGTFAFALQGSHGAPHPPGMDIPMYWGPIAFQVKTNALGYRCGSPCVEDPLAQPRPRLALLGDSFTYGFFVDEADTFPARVQALLAQTGDTTAVSNLGIPGASIPEQHMAYAHTGSLLQPDWVFLQFYANDIYDFAAFANQVAESVPWAPSSALWLLTRSALAEWALEHYLAWQSEDFLPTAPGQAAFDNSRYRISGQFDFARMVATQKNSHHRELSLSLGHWDKETAGYLMEYLGQLATLHQLASRDGVRLAFLYMPTFLQVYDDQVTPALQQTLKAYCEAQGIPFLDLTPALKAGRETPLYLMPLDHHLSPAGNALVASEVVRFYRELNPRR